ncbi:MAG TPA: hypothetical protein VF310_02980 [Vicinamibacteria bacterium]
MDRQVDTPTGDSRMAGHRCNANCRPPAHADEVDLGRLVDQATAHRALAAGIANSSAGMFVLTHAWPAERLTADQRARRWLAYWQG